MAKNWIAKAINPAHKGALRAVAKRRGMISGNTTLSGADLNQLQASQNKHVAAMARLAQTLKYMHTIFPQKKN